MIRIHLHSKKVNLFYNKMTGNTEASNIAVKSTIVPL